MKRIDWKMVAVFVVIVSVTLYLFTLVPTCNITQVPKPDKDNYQKIQQQLDDHGALLKEIANDQRKATEQAQRKDSLQTLEYQNQKRKDSVILSQLTKDRDEKIKRISSYNSDSLRRAYAE